MMIKRVYSILRIIAYACSLTGVAILLLGRKFQWGDGDIVNMTGFVLVATGFIAFILSYAVFLYSKL